MSPLLTLLSLTTFLPLALGAVIPRQDVLICLTQPDLPILKVKHIKKESIRGASCCATTSCGRGPAWEEILGNRRQVEVERPNGENPSYTLDFMGPALECSDTNFTDLTEAFNISLSTDSPFEYGPFEDGVFEDRLYTSEPSVSNGTTFQIRYYSGQKSIEIAMLASDVRSYFPCLPYNHDHAINETGFSNFKPVNVTLIQPKTKRKCIAAAAEYTIKISFDNGRQNVEYATKGVTPLPMHTPEACAKSPETCILYSDSRGANFSPLRSWEEYTNVLAVLDILGLALNYESQEYGFYELSIPSLRSHQLPNRSIVQACEVNSSIRSYSDASCSVLPFASFNSRRRNGYLIDPSTTLNLTEEMLNDVLVNLTLASLSLNTWSELVNGTDNKTFNIYHFENKLNFFLSYGLCLLLTIPVLVMGLFALRKNGMTAIDGGFTQILMTTTGRTRLNEVAVNGCFGGDQNIPTGFKRMNIRFGELIWDEEMQKKDSSYSGTPSRDEQNPTLPDQDPDYEDGLQETIEANNGTGYTKLASGITTSTSTISVARRVGFGTAEETRPLN
ncbi:hypothetical protein EJ04DRAFT_584008 [Polyplosphaeria fusca]|uniref:Uncharacterized protein n=1 Tax=Polyplosphaeria fusca TaxID=682080 RepID=A0A9P4UWN4_9PLEO|nr:hypothetical protein EJ04DRAFT_584008 [Polyplosphaeria fusca]